MIMEGDFVLLRFPQTDLAKGKLRPVLLLRRVPNKFEDWLVCMVSTQLNQQVEGLEIILSEVDEDFSNTGLKATSLLRTSRLAVVDQTAFEGKLGTIAHERLNDVRKRIASWLLDRNRLELEPTSKPGK